MEIITDKLTLERLKQMAVDRFGDLVKAVIDVGGINFYPEMSGDDFIEFDSMINMRPSQGNRSRGIENIELSKRIYRDRSKED